MQTAHFPGCWLLWSSGTLHLVFEIIKIPSFWRVQSFVLKITLFLLLEIARISSFLKRELIPSLLKRYERSRRRLGCWVIWRCLMRPDEGFSLNRAEFLGLSADRIAGSNRIGYGGLKIREFRRIGLTAWESDGSGASELGDAGFDDSQFYGVNWMCNCLIVMQVQRVCKSR